MLTRTIGRFGAAAVLAVGLLVATSMPASASATGVIIEASSTINIQTTTTPPTTVANVHIKGHATTNVCAPNSTPPTPIPVSLNSTGGGTVGASTTGWGDFPVGTNNFKTRLVITGGSINLSTTGSSVTLTIKAEFRTCDSLTNICTTNNANITLSGPSVGHHPTPSTRVTVAGISTHITTSFATCNVILSAVLNSRVAVANLSLHFV